jgi:hypothetical protein
MSADALIWIGGGALVAVIAAILIWVAMTSRGRAPSHQDDDTWRRRGRDSTSGDAATIGIVGAAAVLGAGDDDADGSDAGGASSGAFDGSGVDGGGGGGDGGASGV